MPLRINPELELPDADLALTFVRASGPGGQNVNKVASAVQLRFDLAGTSALSEAVKTRLAPLAGRRLTADGAVLIIARSQRTQEGNRRDAEERLAELVRRALIVPKVRTATRPTRASRERRLERKGRNARTKRLRNKPGWDE